MDFERRVGRGHGWMAIVVSAMLLATPLSGHAQELSRASREAALDMMDRGDALFEQRDFEGALKQYEGAWDVVQVPSTGLAVAQTLAAMGRLLAAREMATKTVSLPKKIDESPVLVKARAGAATLVAQLEVRIPRVTLKPRGMKPDDPVELYLDGKLVTEPTLQVDPGPHAAEARSKGYRTASVPFAIRDNETKELLLELVVLEQSVPKPIAPPPPPADVPKRPWSPLVVGGLAVGGLGIAVGTVAGIVTLSKASSATDNCTGGVCPSSSRSDVDGANTWATTSNIGFGVGAVGLAVASVAWFARSNEPPAKAANRSRLLVVPAGAGVAVTGAF